MLTRLQRDIPAAAGHILVRWVPRPLSPSFMLFVLPPPLEHGTFGPETATGRVNSSLWIGRLVYRSGQIMTLPTTY